MLRGKRRDLLNINCPNCMFGYLIYQDIYYIDNPDKYEHKCDNCRTTFYLDKKYPIVLETELWEDIWTGV